MSLVAMVNIVYGACVGSWDKFQANVVRPGRQIVAISGQTDIAVAYNRILRAVQGYDMLILLHDDLEITDPNAEDKFAAALENDVALVGVAGGGGRGGLAWWNQHPVGHQRTDVTNIDFGPRFGEVDLIEGSIMVFSRWAIEELRFDEKYPGFHGYDEVAASARHRGKRVVVADVDTHHHTNMGFKSEQSHAEWLAGDQRYREKWL